MKNISASLQTTLFYFLWNRNQTTLVESAKAKFIVLYTVCVNELLENDKTKFILLHTVTKPTPNNFDSIETSIMKIERNSSYEYLRVYMDEMVHWTEHGNHVCTSLVKYLGISNPIKHMIASRNLHSTFMLFKKCEYGNDVYGSYSNMYINRVQIIQYRLIKLLLNLDPETPFMGYTGP